MNELAKEYGEGLYVLSRDENLTEQLLSELEGIAACFREQSEYIHLLSNLSIPKSERCGILDNTFRGRIHPYLLNFLKILCERGCIAEYGECIKAYRERYYRDHNIVEALVTTAQALTPGQKESLVARLEAKSGRKILLREKIDASVLDGVLLEMDGKRIDGTLRRRLAELGSLIANEA